MRWASLAVLASMAWMTGSALAAETPGPVWWQRGADKWYYKDDWKGQALIAVAGKDNQPSAFTKTIAVPGGAASGWIVIWGDRGYRLTVNGKPVGSCVDGGLIDDYDLTAFLAGQESAELRIEGSMVCAEGEIVGKDGQRYAFATGADWQEVGAGKPKLEKMAVQPSDGAYNRSHNGLMMTYNEEERGKTAIAKALGRIQKLNEQGVFLMRRYRPAQSILSFDPNSPWRRAERQMGPLLEQAKAILTDKAIPAQKAGKFADAIAAAEEASALILSAETPVAAATELYQAQRELTHLANWAAFIGQPAKPLQESLAEMRGLSIQGMAALSQGDLAAWEKAHARIQELDNALRPQLETLAGAKLGPLVAGLGELDEFPEDRFGWLNARELMGNDPINWPFVAAPSSAAYIDLAGQWDFRLDPDNVGAKENWATASSSDGWKKIFAPKPWERQGYTEDNVKAPNAPIGRGGKTGEDKPYNGFAWYRKSVFVPAQWQGRKIVLETGNVQNWSRVFVNGKPITEVKGEEEARRLTPGAKGEVPEGVLEFGKENVIAIQVYNQDNFGGIIAGPLAMYPAAARPSFRETPGPMSYAQEYVYPGEKAPVQYTLFYSAYSPAVVVASDQSRLELWGWEARGYALPESVTFKTDKGLQTIKLAELSIDALKGTTESWLLLRGGSTNAMIQLARMPKAIAWTKNAQGAMGLSVEFAAGPARAVVLSMPTDVKMGEQACALWLRAMQLYPVAASQFVTAGLDSKGMQGVMVRYNYFAVPASRLALSLGQDSVAPVPMLASYAMKYKFPGLQIPNAKSTGYRSQYASYTVVDNAEAVTYQAPAVDRSKMMKGVGELFGRAKVQDNVHGGLGEIAMYNRMVEWGFDHCRYALAFDANWDLQLVKSMGAPVMENNEANWKRLDEIVANCNKTGMQMMLCSFPEIGSRRWAQHPDWETNTLELWRRFADRYKDLPEWAISYDFFNEPAYMNTGHWNRVMKEFTQAVRSVDKKHMIVWESADGWAQPFWCLWMEPVKDDNVLYSFHHYGKHWGYAYDEYYPGYQSTFERTQVDPWLEAILFGLQHNVPIHCGEFGLSMIQPAGNGEAWLNDYLGFFERFGIGWNWWNYSGADIYRTGLAAENRISPYVPIMTKWMSRSGWGAARRAAGQMPPIGSKKE